MGCTSSICTFGFDARAPNAAGGAAASGDRPALSNITNHANNAQAKRPIPPNVKAEEADACLLRGNHLASNQSYRDAIPEFTKAIALRPHFPRAFVERGMCYRALAQREDAVADFTSALTLDEKNFQALKQRAETLVDATSFDKALRDLDACIALAPDDADCYRLRADCFRQQGDMCAALEDYEKADELLGSKCCMVCMEEPRASRLHPCMHAALCLSCAQALKERARPCPICGKGIDSVESGMFLKTYAFGEGGGSGEDKQAYVSSVTRRIAAVVAQHAADASPSDSESVFATPMSALRASGGEEGEGMGTVRRVLGWTNQLETIQDGIEERDVLDDTPGGERREAEGGNVAAPDVAPNDASTSPAPAPPMPLTPAPDSNSSSNRAASVVSGEATPTDVNVDPSVTDASSPIMRILTNPTAIPVL